MSFSSLIRAHFLVHNHSVWIFQRPKSDQQVKANRTVAGNRNGHFMKHTHCFNDAIFHFQQKRHVGRTTRCHSETKISQKGPWLTVHIGSMFPFMFCKWWQQNTTKMSSDTTGMMHQQFHNCCHKRFAQNSQKSSFCVQNSTTNWHMSIHAIPQQFSSFHGDWSWLTNEPRHRYQYRWGWRLLQSERERRIFLQPPPLPK